MDPLFGVTMMPHLLFRRRKGNEGDTRGNRGVSGVSTYIDLNIPGPRYRVALNWE